MNKASSKANCQNLSTTIGFAFEISIQLLLVSKMVWKKHGMGIFRISLCRMGSGHTISQTIVKYSGSSQNLDDRRICQINFNFYCTFFIKVILKSSHSYLSNVMYLQRNRLSRLVRKFLKGLTLIIILRYGKIVLSFSLRNTLS